MRADTLAPVSERYVEPNTSETPDFQRHVVPLLSRSGCNGRSCHGSFQGRGGLRLSLFGYDFKMDYRSLTASSSAGNGHRIDRKNVAQSLILLKPTEQVDHEGGERFGTDSWQQHLLERWIEIGASGIEQPDRLLRLEVEPKEMVFGTEPEPVSLQVTAVWQGNEREDVTPLCRFRSNNDAVAAVDEDGIISSTGIGDTHIVVFYDNGIATVPVLRPHAHRMTIESRNALAGNRDTIDRLVQSKLDKLGIVPSELCTDSEFLRRVSIDLTGTLPTPDEVDTFLKDPGSEKRAHKVDELLERSTYAAYWANKLCDFTGCNPTQQAELGQETAAQWYQWIHRRVLENIPYDELVRRIVLARGRTENQSYDDYTAQVSAYFRDDEPDDFAARPTMPHYWTRRSMQKSEDAAQAFAHNFLGIRLQCAQCHKHPFARWTQHDFEEFSRFFDNVNFGVPPQSLDRYRELAAKVGLTVRDDMGAPVSNEVLRHARHGGTIPWRELYIAPRDEPQSLELLQSHTVSLSGEEDPRVPIMEWMSRPDHPWFARAFVNRVWASYFHVGIIDPPDDLNEANPPSNPALLDWLVTEFVKHDFDMKWLHREIVTSETYQRSWRPNDTNLHDRQNYSRAIPRRMPAEVVYDSVKQALEAAEFADQVRNDLTRRAIGELSMRLAGTYAMQVFGKPDRAVNCDCERANQPTLLQSIFLQNDPLMNQRIEGCGWLAELKRQESSGVDLDHRQVINEAWLRTLSRVPTADESARALRHFQSVDATSDGVQDLLWALLNTKEFVLIK